MIAHGLPCLGIVLAGGLSSRMGQDKAGLTHFSEQAKSMLEFSQTLLKNSGVSDVVISGSYHHAAHHKLNLVNDEFNALGPLAGIYSVWQQYQPQAILALPVDLPLISVNELKQLKLAGELSGKTSFFNEHYLPLYLPMNALTTMLLERTFSEINPNNGKGPSMHKFIGKLQHQQIPLKNANALFNCNTPSDWQTAKNLYRFQRT